VWAVFVLLSVSLAWGASYKLLYTFAGGEIPSGLIFDGAGNLYGTTYYGGAFNIGSVFELSPSAGGWTRTDLYSFTGGADGANPSPYQSLVFDTAGNLYGTTTENTGSGGEVFKLSPNGGAWTLSVLKILKAGAPQGALVFDASGNLYGTISNKSGTVFEMSPASGGSWNYRVLHTFTRNTRDGADPFGALAFDSSGNLYGTTVYGGDASNCGAGCGTVFKFTPASGGTWHYRVIYRFKGGTDGKLPYAGVVSDSAGNLYGTTKQGGNTGCGDDNGGCGIVFELSPISNGTYRETRIHVFTDSSKDRSIPFDGLILDHAGNLFGTTSSGGSLAWGTVYKLTPTAGRWKETVLYNFGDNGDGGQPDAGLISDSSGNLYGTTTLAPTAFEVTP
jgi:uncharacterized repeat protein (TIGR03803 family)